MHGTYTRELANQPTPYAAAAAAAATAVVAAAAAAAATAVDDITRLYVTTDTSKICCSRN